MGIWSPAAYDQLLLTKCKTLLETAFNNPKRRTAGPTTFERFVRDLDTEDSGSIAAMEALVYETTVRRRAPVASGSGSTSRNQTTSDRRDRSSSSRRPTSAILGEQAARTWRLDGSTSTVGVLPPRTIPRRTVTRRYITSDTSDSDEDDSMTIVQPVPAVRGGGGRTIPGRANPIVRQTDSVGAGAGNSNPRAMTWSQFLSEEEENPAANSNNNNEGDDLTSDHSTRAQLLNDLFGYEDPPRADVLALPSRYRFTDPLPTYEELWDVLLDDPFPRSEVFTFVDLLRVINSSSYSSTPLVAVDLRGLINELNERDPTIMIRVRNVVTRRQRSRVVQRDLAFPLVATTGGGEEGSVARSAARMAAHEAAARRRNGRAAGGAVEDGAGGGAMGVGADEREGIWRSAFTESFEPRDVTADLSAYSFSPEVTADFEAHTSRRRHLDREEQTEGSSSSSRFVSLRDVRNRLDLRRQEQQQRNSEELDGGVFTMDDIDADELAATRAIQALEDALAGRPSSSNSSTPSSTSAPTPSSTLATGSAAGGTLTTGDTSPHLITLDTPASSLANSCPPSPPATIVAPTLAPAPQSSAAIAEAAARRRRLIAGLPSSAPTGTTGRRSEERSTSRRNVAPFPFRDVDGGVWLDGGVI